MGQHHHNQKARVICLHGFPGHPDDWEQLATFMASDRDVLSAPMPWHKEVATSGLTISQIVQFCGILIDEHAQEPTHLVGHDLGGLVLWWLSQTSLKTRIASITIISSPHPLAYRKFAVSPEYASRTAYIDDIASGPNILGERILANEPELGPAIVAGLGETNLDSLVPLYAEIKAAGSTPITHLPSPPALPVALISSAEDATIVEETMSETAALLGDAARVLITDDASHFPHLKHPNVVNSFLKEFWDGTGY